MANSNNKIIQRSDYGTRQKVIVGDVFSPGHLVEAAADGDYQKHSTEGGNGRTVVATEDVYQGEGLSIEGTTSPFLFTVDEEAQTINALPGDVIKMFLQAGQNVNPDDALISGGDGTLIDVATVSTTTVVIDKVYGYPQTAVDLSASGAVDTRISVVIA